MLILASGSPRRAKILRDCGVEFMVVKSDAPEVSYPHDPERTVKENALAKGQIIRGSGVSPLCQESVLSADTIVWFNNRIYGKPRDLDEAKEYLSELSGNVHTVFTGVAYNGEVKVVKSDVKFRNLSEAMIDEYVARVKPTELHVRLHDLNLAVVGDAREDRVDVPAQFAQILLRLVEVPRLAVDSVVEPDDRIGT